MLYPPGFYFVKKPKRFVILSSDKSSERNLSSFFDMKKPRRIEHLQSEEPFSSDPYFRRLRDFQEVLPKEIFLIMGSTAVDQVTFEFIFASHFTKNYILFYNK